MCISPITLKNNDHGLGNLGINHLKNTHDSHIQVPCGSCWQCISLRQAYVNQRIQMESLRSYLFYFTLTYRNSSLVKTNIGEYKIAYPYYVDVQNMFKRMRKAGHKFRYWVVSEYGTTEGKTHRPHYHGILAIEKKPGDSQFHHIVLEQFWSKYMLSEWKRNIGSTRSPKWVANCDYHCRRRGLKVESTYDFHYIVPIAGHDNDLSFYLSKYLFKYDDRIYKLLLKINLDYSLDDVQRKTLRSQIKPRSIMSKDFGDKRCVIIQDYIRSCLSLDDKLPQFKDINTGQLSLLSPYYRSLIPVKWFEDRFEKYSLLPDSLYIPSDEDSLWDDLLNYEDVDYYVNGLKSVKNVLTSKYSF